MIASRRHPSRQRAPLVQAPRPAVFAHRGLATATRENTVAAFRAAVDVGADGVELDVRRTGDGTVVVHHDADVGGVEVGASTFAGVRAAGRRLGYEIPTLAETLAALPAEVWLDVELKEAGWEAAALTLVREARPTDRVAFTSFDATSVAALRARDPGLRLGLLVGSPAPAHGLATHVGELVAAHRRAERAGASFLAPNWRFVATRALRGIHLRDMRAWVWTVNDEALLRRLGSDPRVEAVITDDPALALDVRASSRAPR